VVVDVFVGLLVVVVGLCGLLVNKNYNKGNIVRTQKQF
jgi:hypothetical protein